MIKKNLLFLWGTALLPLLLVLAFYGRLPDTIPTQFQNGTVGYGPRATIWLLAGLPFVCSAIFTIAPKVDPRRRNYRRFQGAYNLFASVLNLFLLLITGVIISESLRPGWLPVDRLVIASLGVLFAVMGNFMPKTGSNFMFGIRTMWTIENDEVWQRTNRLAGKLWFFGGILVAFLGRLPLSGMSLWFSAILAMALLGILPVLYSFLLYRKLQRPDGPSGSR